MSEGVRVPVWCQLLSCTTREPSDQSTPDTKGTGYSGLRGTKLVDSVGCR